MGPQAFNPFNPMIKNYHGGVLPIPNTLGHATYVRSAAEYAFNTGTTTQTDFLVLLQTPTSVASFIFTDNGICTEIPHELLNLNKPLSIRGARLGVELVNHTRADYISGFVSVYESHSPLNVNMTGSNGAIDAASIGILKAMMADSGKVKKYTAAQIAAKPLHVFTKPSSHAMMLDWHPFADITQTANTERDAFTFGVQHQAMSTVVIALHDSSVVNNYRFHVVREDFCRYAAPSLGAQQAQALPGADPNAFNRAARDQSSIA